MRNKELVLKQTAAACGCFMEKNIVSCSLKAMEDYAHEANLELQVQRNRLEADYAKAYQNYVEMRNERDNHFNHLMQYMRVVEDIVGFAGPIEIVKEELMKLKGDGN